MPDTTTLDMTLSEAERLLGVPDGYTHEDVQKAYRSIARKYHPDKWLDKPEADRKKATRIYERANTARRVLLNPSMAKPEPEPTPQGEGTRHAPIPTSPTQPRTQGGREGARQEYENRTTRGRQAGNATGNEGASRQRGNGTQPGGTGGTIGTQGRQQPARGSVSRHGTRPEFNSPTHTYDTDNAPNTRPGTAPWATVGTSEAEREKFNAAKSFADKFGQTRDPEEDEYAADYARYANARYHKASDVLHWTSSIVATLVTVAVAVLVTSQNGMLGGIDGTMGAGNASGTQGTVSGILEGIAPLLTLLLACAIKAILYDMVIAHQMETALDRANPALHGIPLAIGGVAIALFGWYQVGGAAFAWLAVAFAVAGIVSGAIHKASDGDNAPDDA